MTKLLAVLFLFSLVWLTAAQDSNPTGLKHLRVFPQVPEAGPRGVQVEAREILRSAEYPSVVRLNGNVRIESEVCLPVGKDRAVVCDGYTIVTADSAVYHEDTGQLEAHGAVSISPLLHGEMKQRP